MECFMLAIYMLETINSHWDFIYLLFLKIKKLLLLLKESHIP